jgi:Helicase conserved C-terminal domain
MKEAEVRQKLVEALEADLVGPFIPDGQLGGGEEILPLPPSRWYLTGFLAPQGGRLPEADDDESSGELPAGPDTQAEDSGSEEAEPKHAPRFPASLGLSVFLPPGDGGTVAVDVWYADYDKVEVALDHTDKKHIGWKRVPYGPVRVAVPLDPKLVEKGLGVPGSRGLELRGELRKTSMDGLDKDTRVLSLFLVNARTVEEKDRDTQFVFQVRLAFHFDGGFCSRPNRRGEDSEDPDQQVLALLFREQREWAVGHNTSLQKPVFEDGKVKTLRTTQLPRYEVPVVDHLKLDTEVSFEIATFAKLDAKGIRAAVSPLVEAYAEWIENCGKPQLGRDALDKTRTQVVAAASRAKARIAEGLQLLETDAAALQAFQLANQGMHLAALQMDGARADKRYKDGVKPAWRPFQLAFILLSLPSTADPAHPDRQLAELIYFPTGGGKTEAYLGLIAFTLVLRRLRGRNTDHEGRGVAVVLRYTLRLLTLDQLDRAATLICALEEIRRRNPKELGNTRFSIGLWVGSATTANRLRDVHQELNDYTPGKKASPFPLSRCPWCSADIKIENVKLVDAAGKPTKKNFERAVVYCAEPSCLYTEAKANGLGLPVSFVDEQIYRELPAFIVATVDKFAMVPWLGEAGMLFGRVTHADEYRAYGVMHTAPKTALKLQDGYLPPELIVQDELHLISGPLGTMVGLYEAAVDFLCERTINGAPRAPKIICSTATVRRAKAQIKALFGRSTAIFPPRGIDDGDNFFSITTRKKDGRLYVGVAAPGRALRAVSVRTYTTLLAAAQRHFDPKGAPEQPADPYMTLIGYFNSLRELGGMRRLVEDEIRSRLANFDSGKRPYLYAEPHPWAASRVLKLPAELTSREKTETVKVTKARLGARRVLEGREPEPLDVVLASNMISVGLDVDRLGLMVVTGQPKTTSEYIQATSRVGRTYPGLVVTCLNVGRPRDRSHYERFAAYHESFYREVEATSVTPFSGQTLDRGLVATLLSMIRHGIPAMEPATGAMKVHDHRPAADSILEWLVQRGRHHREFEDDAAEVQLAELVRKRGRNFLDAWERVADRAREAAGSRTYSRNDRAADEGKPLLFTAVDADPPDDPDEKKFEAPTSMRDVEPSVHVWLRFKPLDSRS